ncbi:MULTISPECIES: hypothetical protein [unclassified Micromonospora]|uniref:hypothetical protein n=1 Tax=unclassified Micromonospora TaxID=2617518 RepID=UPI003A863941
MAGTVAEVIAQLARASTGLSSAAATALRAQQEVTDAHQALSAASAGASAHAVTNATAEWETAADKAGKVARLLMEAVGHLNAYANRIARGSAPDEPMLTGPTGEELLADTTKRSEAQRNVGGFLGRLARKSDDVQDSAKTMGEVAEKVAQVIRTPAGSGGTQSAGTSSPSIVPATPTRIDAADAAGNLVVVGLVAGIAIHKTGQIASRQIARLRKKWSQDKS